MASSEKEKKTFGQKFSEGCASFGEFMHSKNENGETLVMGRTGNSWAKIGFFYLIFYGFLAGFFSAMLAVFLSTVNKPGEGGPKLTKFIKNQPGLSRIDQGSNRLKFPYMYNDEKEDGQVKLYEAFVTKYLNRYNQGDNSGEKCDPNNKDGIPEGAKHCIYDYETELGPCANSSNSYGLEDRNPCIFIKINKIFDWMPKTDSNYLELSCDKGKVYPSGFMLAAFPFRGQTGYQAPIVALQVDTSNNDEITVTCELKGDNVEVSDTSVASRAFGKIKIEDIASKPKPL